VGLKISWQNSNELEAIDEREIVGGDVLSMAPFADFVAAAVDKAVLASDLTDTGRWSS
jgi:hypothetical protein